MHKKEIIAAFDFDGTLTYRDTLVTFLKFAVGTPTLLSYLSLELPQMLGFVMGLVPRQTTKEAILTRFFAGKHSDEIRAQGEAFAAAPLAKCLRPNAMERLRWHQEQGHRCFLVSAQIDTYLDPWGQANGFEQSLSSQLEIDTQGIVTGKLIGKNCWGPEKVKRLEALLGDRKAYTLYAYGNSRGDQELLAYADYPFYRYE